MPMTRFTIAGILFRVLAAALLGAAMLAMPAAVALATTGTCTSSGKCFTVTVSPSPTALAGTTTSFTFTIKNEASTQQLGSAQITAPAGFVITGAPGSASFTSSSALFLNLSVPPSGTTTLKVTALLPCSGPYQWGIKAKQSNDFSGPPGNDFQLDTGNLSGTLTGSCSLAFTSDGQPTGTAVSPAMITSGFGSSGGPVKIAVLDASGQTIANQAAIGSMAVTVAIGSNPGSGTLSGTTTENTSAGVASFSDLNIGQQGIGYTLTASSSSNSVIKSGTSTHFTIFGSLNPCRGSSCSAKSSTPTTTGTVMTSSVIPTDLLGTGIGGLSVSDNYSCGTYQSVSDPFSFDLFDPKNGAAEQTAQFSASLDISKSAAQSSPNTGVSSWQICYASTSSFTARAGTSGNAVIGGVSYFTGLLPDCSSTQGAPCVEARNKGNGGDVIITFLAVGDPLGKG